MPLQTGSVIQRHVQVKADHQTKPAAETKKKKKPPEPKPEPEPEAEAETPAKPRPTPTPSEESTPPTERFR